LLLASCGGGPSTPQKAVEAESAKVELPVTVEPPREAEPREAREDRRAFVFFRKSPQRHRASLWRESEADPAVAEQLPFVVDFSPEGASGVGTTTPLLSQDGAWLAYLDQGHLVVARLDGTMKERVTRHGAAQVSVLISGFSPDSTTLLFEQHEVQAEGGMPLPADVQAGFTLLTLTGYRRRHLPDLPAFEAWSPDSKRVLLERRAGGASELVAYAVEAGKIDVLQRAPGTFGFSQLVVGADTIVYVREPSQVVRSKLDGSALVELSSAGDFAQYQWPRLSTDGKQVAYRNGVRVVHVGIDGGDAIDVTSCGTGDCEHTWESGTELLVRDGPALTRYDLAGHSTVIATDTLGFVVAGDPG
jgi:Tol biopolymer transport system component